MPFRDAALILTQVVDQHPGQNTFTTDLGYKNMCSNQPIEARVRLLSRETAALIMHNEEFGVFRVLRR